MLVNHIYHLKGLDICKFITGEINNQIFGTRLRRGKFKLGTGFLTGFQWWYAKKKETEEKCKLKTGLCIILQFLH